MSTIRAFVGHSFVPTDSDLVRVFLQYFSQISGSDFNFSWDHAEQAETRVLSEKVISLMKESNLFIAICTKKEYALQDQNLHNVIFFKNKMMIDRQNVVWKTSDWIIQEIGLATGLGLKIIILLERGVRRPGGLQGDLEYIEFVRERPQESFGKILEMLRSVKPKTENYKISSNDEKKFSAGDYSDTKDSERSDDWLIPTEDWHAEAYTFAYSFAILKENIDAAKLISDTFLESPYGSEPQDKIWWEAHKEYVNLRSNNYGSIDEIRRILVENPNNEKVIEIFAKAHQDFSEYEKACSIYLDAADKAKGTRIGELLCDALRCAIRTENWGRSESIVLKMKSEYINNNCSNMDIISGISELCKCKNREFSAIALNSYQIECYPDDVDLRFSLAYDHSRKTSGVLSLSQYMRVPNSNRSGVLWNNLGVQLGAKALPVLSVDAFREAVKKDETLAMSNLGRKYLEQGFLDEAKDMCELAISQEDCHANVGTLLSDIRNVRDAEIKKLEKIKKRVFPIERFLVELGRAAIALDNGELIGVWKGPECSIKFEGDVGDLIGIGIYNKDVVLGGLLSIGEMGKTESASMNVEIRVSGVGHCFEGTIKRKRIDGRKLTSTLLTGGEDSCDVLMYYCQKSGVICVLENFTDEESYKIYDLVSVNDLS